ncbi:MAG: NERD domain-containing protein [Gammaproteobacteria bacterium]|nr:NERD domain-containing protein [Gammaproteobacteria bacterium]
MYVLIRFLASSLPLIVLPAIAAVPAPVSGIGNVHPATFFFILAGALLLTLVFRHTVQHFLEAIGGYLGAARIRRALDRRSPDVLHDFILPGAYGGLKKIDHAILTAGGILCIQAKHYNGIVFGAEDEPQWTNVDGTRRRRFLNPLIQNEGRARAIRNVLADVPVANLVVFTGKMQFSAPPPANVIRIDALDSYIAKFVFGPSKIKDWDAVWMTLKAAALTDADSRKDLQAQIA